MATRPTEPTTLGKFLPYPSDATGVVAPYWLASSPGSGHRVRMTGACKRAFIATIEAVIERALVPANCGNYPAVNTDFLSLALDAQGLRSLVDLGKWTTVADRAGLGARIKRGCPKEDWDLLVSLVAALWAGGTVSNPAGVVYAWQLDALEGDTDGFVDEQSLEEPIDTMAFQLSSWPADDETPLEDRPWGAYPGGVLQQPVYVWAFNALVSLGASVSVPGHTFDAFPFAEAQLDGSPVPLKVGHEGNWFGSSVSAMTGENKSIRRSSSAWAVLQAMLANMRFTHLLFGFGVVYVITETTRTVVRYITMNSDDEIVVVESSDSDGSVEIESNNELYAESSSGFSSGYSWIEVRFSCDDANVNEQNLLVRFSIEDSGWYHIGAAMPYLTLGDIHVGAAELEIVTRVTTAVDSVTAGNGDEYPAAGFQQYVGAYGPVTFVDSLTGPNVKQFSVRSESGSMNLADPVAAHARWLIGQLPGVNPTRVPACPGTLSGATTAFWDGWDVFYPGAPNIQINGQDAYFPVGFRNSAFVANEGWAITHDQGEWKGGSSSGQGAVFGIGTMAFPGLVLSNSPRHTIHLYNSAMAAHQWRFKAMPTT